MSDIADVLDVLVSRAACAVYPNGTNSPSISGADITIYPGWPSSDNLDKDLLAGKTHVSVFPKAEERNTTRYPEKCIVIHAPSTTLTLAVDPVSLAVTVGGTVSVPQNLMLRVSGKDYVYSVQASDTLNSVAAALAALVAVDFGGTSEAAAVITIGSGGRLQAARVGGFGTVTREIRRQERVVMITIWAGSPALRDQVASAIDVDLAAQKFLTMPDGFAARLIYKNSLVVDSLQKAVLYRRDLNYSVEFATTETKQAAAVIAPKLTLQPGTTTTI